MLSILLQFLRFVTARSKMSRVRKIELLFVGLEIFAGSSYRGSVCHTGAKIGSIYREFRGIEGSRNRRWNYRAWVKQIQGNQGLVRDIVRFGKPRVREIGLPLYCTTSECLDWLYGAISHEIDDNRFLCYFCREFMLICLGIKDSKELKHRKSSTSTLLTSTDSFLKSYLKVILTKQVIRIAENSFVICQ